MGRCVESAAGHLVQHAGPGAIGEQTGVPWALHDLGRELPEAIGGTRSITLNVCLCACLPVV